MYLIFLVVVPPLTYLFCLGLVSYSTSHKQCRGRLWQDLWPLPRGAERGIIRSFSILSESPSLSWVFCANLISFSTGGEHISLLYVFEATAISKLISLFHLLSLALVSLQTTHGAPPDPYYVSEQGYVFHAKNYSEPYMPKETTQRLMEKSVLITYGLVYSPHQHTSSTIH